MSGKRLDTLFYRDSLLSKSQNLNHDPIRLPVQLIFYHTRTTNLDFKEGSFPTRLVTQPTRVEIEGEEYYPPKSSPFLFVLSCFDPLLSHPTFLSCFNLGHWLVYDTIDSRLCYTTQNSSPDRREKMANENSKGKKEKNNNMTKWYRK